MTEVSIAPGAVSTIGILHATLVGAVVSGTIFITCWFLSFTPVTATHSLISLFTTAEQTSLAALALGLCWSIIFGAWVGFLIAIVNKFVTSITTRK